MEFDYTMGIETRNKDKINKRKTIKGVAIKGNKLLMLKTNKGDYELPGGGMKEGEEFPQALKREMKEESGYSVIAINKLIGRILHRKIDSKDNDSIFELDSYYYLCEVNNIPGEQKLETNELELEFTPIWVNINDAIKINEMNIGMDERRNFILEREIKVLKFIKNNFILKRG